MLPEFKLERFFAEHEFSAKHLLCSSDCQSMSVGKLLDFEPQAREQFFDLHLGYTESPGSPTLRAEIAKLYDNISAEDVVVFAGAQEGILLFLQGQLAADDHAIVHWPCYQSLFEVAHSAGGSVDRWTADASNDWALDLNQLDSLIRPNTKVIVVNTPHNPTGYLFSHEDWANLHSLAAERGVLVFCDEVYRESEQNPEDRLTAGCDMGSHGVSLGVMSKTYGLAGLRIGWVASQNADVIGRLRAMKDYTSICNSAPSEFLAELALRHRQRLVERSLGIIKSNLESLDRFFQTHPDQFHWVRPKAGAIAFPELTTGEAIEPFCERLLKETGVLLAPGTMFDDPGNHFRLGFGRSDFAEGLGKIESWMG